MRNDKGTSACAQHGTRALAVKQKEAAEELKCPLSRSGLKVTTKVNGSEHRHLRVLVPFLIEEAKFRLTRMMLNTVDKRLSTAGRWYWHDRATELAKRIEEGRLR